MERSEAPLEISTTRSANSGRVKTFGLEEGLVFPVVGSLAIGFALMGPLAPEWAGSTTRFAAGLLPFALTLTWIFTMHRGRRAGFARDQIENALNYLPLCVREWVCPPLKYAVIRRCVPRSRPHPLLRRPGTKLAGLNYSDGWNSGLRN